MLNLKALEGKVSTVQMGAFATKFHKGLELFSLRILEDKTAVWQAPFPGTTPMPWVDVEKDTGAFVQALIDAPAPTQMLGVSESMTGKDTLDLWSAVTGVKSRFEETLPEAVDIADDPTGFKLGLLQTAQFVAEFGYTGGDPDVLLPEDLEKRGISVPRTKLADYMSREDWSKVIG